MSALRRTFALVGLAVGLTTTSLAAQTGMPADSLAYARQITTWFFAGEADSLVAHSDSGGQGIEAEAEWQDRLASFTARIGTETEVLEEKFVKRNGSTQYWRTSKYSNYTTEPFMIRWAFNKQGQLIGAGINPKSQAPPIDPD